MRKNHLIILLYNVKVPKVNDDHEQFVVSSKSKGVY